MAEEYRVWVRDPGSAAALEKSATAVRRMLTGLPGVDQVHIEPKG